MNIICVISARGGSKGVSGKNMRMLAGKPLIAWSILQAKNCKDISKVVVSTDSKEIADIALEYGAEVPFMRPDNLAIDEAGKWTVWQHALAACEKNYNTPVDIYVDLDCTSPLRTSLDISAAIEKFKASQADGLFTICEARKNPYFNMVEIVNGKLQLSKEPEKKIVRRQDAPKVYEHVASIYVLQPKFIRSGTGLLSGNLVGFDIGQEKSLDIDTEFDFKLMELLMKSYENEI